MVIDLPAAALHNEDIFLAHALADLDTSLAHAELGEDDLGGRYAEVGADLLGELRVRASREKNEVANHRCGGGGVVSVDEGESEVSLAWSGRVVSRN